MIDVFDQGNYQVRYEKTVIGGRGICVQILGYSKDGLPVSRALMAQEYGLIEEDDIQKTLDENL